MREFEYSEKARPSDGQEHITGRYDAKKDFVQDPKGYFLIKVDKQRKEILVGFCRNFNVIEIIISGKTPQEIYFTASERGLISRHDHAAYLGKELEKAYLALKFNLPYVQDEELRLR